MGDTAEAGSWSSFLALCPWLCFPSPLASVPDVGVGHVGPAARAAVMLESWAPAEELASFLTRGRRLSSVERLVVLSAAAPNRVVCRRFMSKKIVAEGREPGPATPLLL